MNHFTEQEKLEHYAQQIQESGIDITPDQKNEWTMIAYACASQGEAGRESFHRISSNYPGYSREECDRHFDFCLKTSKNCVSLGTLVKIAKDHGVDLKLPRGRRVKSGKQKEKERRAAILSVKKLLLKDRHWRYNVLSNKTEYSENDSAWSEVDDRFIDTILTRLRESGLRVKDNELRSLINSSDFAPDFAPHLEWLNSLPAWKPGDPDYIHDFFIGHMIFGPLADVEFSDLMFRRWLVAMIALWKGLIDSNPLMPTFCGSQQIGKSFFAMHVLPPCLQQYQTSIRPNDPINTDTMLTLSEVLLIIFDEISISSDSKSNMFKFLITSGQTNLRDAYGHYRKVRRRMASPIATTNYLQFIRESEGNRRYLGIDLIGTKNIYEFPLNYEGAYAQALYLLENGFEPKPTFEESRQISLNNTRFMMLDDTEEVIKRYLRKPNEGENALAMTSSDIQHMLMLKGYRNTDFTTNKIGKAMTKMEFLKKHTNRGTAYMVWQISDTDIEKAQTNDASGEKPF